MTEPAPGTPRRSSSHSLRRLEHLPSGASSLGAFSLLIPRRSRIGGIRRLKTRTQFAVSSLLLLAPRGFHSRKALPQPGVHCAGRLRGLLATPSVLGRHSAGKGVSALHQAVGFSSQEFERAPPARLSPRPLRRGRAMPLGFHPRILLACVPSVALSVEGFRFAPLASASADAGGPRRASDAMTSPPVRSGSGASGGGADPRGGSRAMPPVRMPLTGESLGTLKGGGCGLERGVSGLAAEPCACKLQQPASARGGANTPRTQKVTFSSSG
jgi:hypothetical protein